MGIASDTVCGDERKLYRLSRQCLFYKGGSLRTQCCLIPAVYLEDIFAEFHLTDVDSIVVTVNDQVYLCLCRPP